MNRGYQNGRGNYSMARPAGASDEDEVDSDDGFDLHGFPRRSRQKYVPVNGSSAGHTSAALPDEDWDAEVGFDQQLAIQEPPSTVIRFACIRGNLDKLKEQLANTPNYNINECFKETNETPLILACMHARFEVVEYLIDELAANPNLRHPFEKRTPLMAVAGSEREECEEDVLKCSRKLVQAGADVNKQERYGLTALMIAVLRKRMEMVLQLLEAGADPNLVDYQDGRTALFLAVVNGDGRMCRRLIEHGADVKIEDSRGFCVPEFAQDNDHIKLANFLFLVKETKWKPGLHPELMNQLDEEVALERSRKVDQLLSIKSESALEMMLQAVDGQKYLGNFIKHKITYKHFLTLDENQLKEIGVDEVGVRERLLDLIQKTHNLQWQSSSIRSIASNKKVTAAEAVCMVVNIREHLQHISSSLIYLNKRIQQEPLNLKYDIERNKIEDIMKFCEETELMASQVRQSLLNVHKTIGELQGYSELQILGRLPKRSFKGGKFNNADSKLYSKLANRKMIGLMAVCCFIGLKYLKRLY